MAPVTVPVVLNCHQGELGEPAPCWQLVEQQHQLLPHVEQSIVFNCVSLCQYNHQWRLEQVETYQTHPASCPCYTPPIHIKISQLLLLPTPYTSLRFPSDIYPLLAIIPQDFVAITHLLARQIALPLLLPLLPGQKISLLPILQLAHPIFVPPLYSLVSLSSE